MTPLRAALVALSTGALALAACQPVLVEVPFPRTEPDDDDTTDPTDDDDVTEPTNELPSIQVTEPTPTDLLAGTVSVGFTVSDPDSVQVDVSVSYSISGTAGVFLPATVGPAADLSISVDEPPISDLAGTVAWDTETDVPVATAEGVLKLCPADGEGNAGTCVFWPPVGGALIVNEATSWPGSFCEPGTVEGTHWVAGQSVVPLSDGVCLNHQSSSPPQPDDFAARFLVVLTNPNPSDVVFALAPSNGELDLSGPPPPLPPQPGAPTLEPRPTPYIPPPLPMGGECDSELGADDVGSHISTFYVRSGIDPDADRWARGATLQALGEHVAIYVDNETPIDWDSDCDDPGNAIVPDASPAFGFDNCDLDDVVEVFDVNVFPTVTGAFGEPSDVDGNCRVTVLLSHRVNGLTTTDADLTNDRFAVKSFAEPDIDLWQSDLVENRNSNEAEIIFVHAPDPAGLWSEEEIPLEGYLDYQLAGRMAVALQDLVSYAHHVGVTDAPLVPGTPVGEPEEDWLDDALGLLAADLSGFGAIAFTDAWVYLDRPHLLPLIASNSLADFEDRGGQYLLARYLYDIYGADLLPALIDGEDTGVAGLEAALGMEFETIALQWATAMGVSGRVRETGTQLVPDAVIANFNTSSTVVVPESPVPGDHVGAAGFQQGFNLRAPNLTMAAGSDDGGPVELEELRALTRNLDPLVYHPQAEFFGTVAGGYGVTAVVVAGLVQPINYFRIETVGSETLLANVIRLSDESPHAPSLTLEEVDGPLLTTVRELGELDVGGDERRVIGRVDPSQPIDISLSVELAEPDPMPSVEVGSISDTDRYAFSLTAVSHIGVMVERRYSGLSGGAQLSDPFVAVVPMGDVPDPWDYAWWGFGPSDADGACSDSAVFDYPVVVPDFVVAQGILAADPVDLPGFEPVTDWTASPEDEPVALPLPCLYDRDQDGVPDAEEAFPLTLVDQVRQRQAEHIASDPTTYTFPWSLMPGYEDVDLEQPFWGADFIDLDSNEWPDDDIATSLPQYALGGRAVATGEEAVWLGQLPPGDYLLVVGGAGGSTGPYDLSVRHILE